MNPKIISSILLILATTSYAEPWDDSKHQPTADCQAARQAMRGAMKDIKACKAGKICPPKTLRGVRHIKNACKRVLKTVCPDKTLAAANLGDVILCKHGLVPPGEKEKE